MLRLAEEQADEVIAQAAPARRRDPRAGAARRPGDAEDAGRARRRGHADGPAQGARRGAHRGDGRGRAGPGPGERPRPRTCAPPPSASPTSGGWPRSRRPTPCAPRARREAEQTRRRGRPRGPGGPAPLAVEKERLTREAAEHHSSATAETARLVEEAEAARDRRRGSAPVRRSRQATPHREQAPTEAERAAHPGPPRGRADRHVGADPGRELIAAGHAEAERELRRAQAPRSTASPSAATRSSPSSARCGTWSPGSPTSDARRPRRRRQPEARAAERLRDEPASPARVAHPGPDRTARRDRPPPGGAAGLRRAAGPAPAGPAPAVLHRLPRRPRRLLVGGLAASSAIGGVLVLVVVALFLAAGLNPVVEFSMRRGLRRAWAVLRGHGSCCSRVVAVLRRDRPGDHRPGRRAHRQRPGLVRPAAAQRQIQDLDDEYDVIDKAQDYVTSGDFASRLFGGASASGSRCSALLANAFIVIVLTLYFLASLPTRKRGALPAGPGHRAASGSPSSATRSSTASAATSPARSWSRSAPGHSLVFLFIVGLGEYAVALAFVVAILDVIPMIGATLGAVVVSAIAFATDPKIGHRLRDLLHRLPAGRELRDLPEGDVALGRRPGRGDRHRRA